MGKRRGKKGELWLAEDDASPSGRGKAKTRQTKPACGTRTDSDRQERSTMDRFSVVPCRPTDEPIDRPMNQRSPCNTTLPRDWELEVREGGALLFPFGANAHRLPFRFEQNQPGLPCVAYSLSTPPPEALCGRS